MTTDFSVLAAFRQNRVEIFQGHEWADPYGYGEIDPEGAWAELNRDGWYFSDVSDGHHAGDPVGPFLTEADAEIEWATRFIRNDGEG